MGALVSIDWSPLFEVLHVRCLGCCMCGLECCLCCLECCMCCLECCMCGMGVDVIACAASARPAGLRRLLEEGQCSAA